MVARSCLDGLYYSGRGGYQHLAGLKEKLRSKCAAMCGVIESSDCDCMNISHIDI